MRRLNLETSLFVLERPRGILGPPGDLCPPVNREPLPSPCKTPTQSIIIASWAMISGSTLGDRGLSFLGRASKDLPFDSSEHVHTRSRQLISWNVSKSVKTVMIDLNMVLTSFKPNFENECSHITWVTLSE
jgi:hypothetical protein